ncbi:MAG: pyridoxamine 5'-phosphate oxidase family protein [Microthrixaceae bacterium]
MDPNTEDRDLVELDEDECATLLVLESVGRLAVGDATAAPDVVPVNFVVRDGDPVFRSHPGVLLDRVLSSPVSLQVDRFDWFHRTGWSVLVHGVAELVDPDLAGALIEEGDDTLDTWAPGDQPVLVRVRVEYLSGRRIELQQIPLDGRGYL